MKSFLYKYSFAFTLVLFVHQGYGQGFLKASGKKIIDGNGQEVILRGMGLGGWMLQEPYMLQLSGAAVNQGDIKNKITELIGKENTEIFYESWLQNFCTKADIDSIAAWGFNSVRLTMHYNLFTLPIEQEPVEGKQTWLQTGFDLTDSLLSWCKANKLYLILDLHAAPGGQGNDNAISDRDTTKLSLWQSEANQQKTIALWKKLAEKYANEKWIGGYDLINEPNWGFQNVADKNGCAETENAPLKKLMVAITKAIREVDTNHIIIVEGNCWGNNYKGVFPLWDDNTVVSFHKYWNDNTQAAIQQFIDLREQHNVPVWMGESGENSNVWFRSAIKLLEQNGIGWAWWPLKKLGFNNPLQIRSNPNYQKIIAYLKKEGAKPNADEAFKGLMQLAEDSRIEKNIFHKDVVDAMFRQVNESKAIPFADHNINNNPIIYAVNFDIGRLGIAYYAIDSANYWVSSGTRTQWNKGVMYRNDAVDIADCSDSITNGYYVTAIKPAEWLQYTFNTDITSTYNIVFRIAASSQSIVNIFLNEKKLTQKFSVPNESGWYSVVLKNIELKKGINKIKFAVGSGEVDLNFLKFERINKDQVKK